MSGFRVMVRCGNCRRKLDAPEKVPKSYTVWCADCGETVEGPWEQ